MYLPIPDYPGYFVGADGRIWSCLSNENPSQQSAAWHKIKKCITSGRHRTHLTGKDRDRAIGYGEGMRRLNFQLVPTQVDAPRGSSRTSV